MAMLSFGVSTSSRYCVMASVPVAFFTDMACFGLFLSSVHSLMFVSISVMLRRVMLVRMSMLSFMSFLIAVARVMAVW